MLKSDVLGEMLEACYEEGREEFAGFVEHFGRGKSDRGIEDVILQAWQFSQSHPWPGEWLLNCRAELEEGNLEEMEQSPWMQFLFQDTARQMEELSAQLRSALSVCGEENGPQAYEPMLLSDVGKLEAIEQAASQGNFEAQMCIRDSIRGYMVVTASLKGTRSMELMRSASTVTSTFTFSLPRVSAALYTPGT